MTRLAAVLAIAALLAACGEKKRPAQRPAAPGAAAAATGPSATATPEAPPAPEWVYSSVGKRDPFKSFLSEMEATASSVLTRCNTPLGRYELEQLRLVAVVTGLEDPVAMVEAPNGVGYAVRRGACMGKNGGVVAAIRSGEVVVNEWAIKADGSRDRTQTLLRLPKEQSLNLEE